MKKFFSIFLAVCMLAALSVGSFVNAEGSAVAIPDNGTAVALPLDQVELEYGYEVETNFVISDTIRSTIPGDAVIWDVNISKAGNYKVSIPVASMDGEGVIGLYVNGTKTYTAGNFKAYGYGNAENFDNVAELYFNAAEAGTYELKLAFESIGASAKAPEVSYFEGNIPEAAPVDQTVSLVQYDGLTNNATKALLLGSTGPAHTGEFYSWQVNTAAAFKGLLIPQWTPGGGANHVVIDVSVHTWTGDFEGAIAAEPVVKTTLTTPGDSILVWDFEKEVPAGEYVIYVKLVEVQGTGHSDIHIKTGLGLYEEYTEDYIYTETDATGYDPFARTAIAHLIVGPDVDTNPEKFFVELGAQPGAEDEEPTEEPTEEPEEETATKKPAPTSKPASSNNSSDDSTIIIVVVVVVVVVVAAAVVAIILIKKKKG